MKDEYPGLPQKVPSWCWIANLPKSNWIMFWFFPPVLQFQMQSGLTEVCSLQLLNLYVHFFSKSTLFGLKSEKKGIAIWVYKVQPHIKTPLAKEISIIKSYILVYLFVNYFLNNHEYKDDFFIKTNFGYFKRWPKLQFWRTKIRILHLIKKKTDWKHVHG